jgi:hypothetical protein
VPIVREFMSSHKVGVVVSAGKMSKAVKVRIAGQEWNKKIRKVRLVHLNRAITGGTIYENGQGIEPNPNTSCSIYNYIAIY